MGPLPFADCYRFPGRIRRYLSDRRGQDAGCGIAVPLSAAVGNPLTIVFFFQSAQRRQKAVRSAAEQKHLEEPLHRVGKGRPHQRRKLASSLIRKANGGMEPQRPQAGRSFGPPALAKGKQAIEPVRVVEMHAVAIREVEYRQAADRLITPSALALRRPHGMQTVPAVLQFAPGEARGFLRRVKSPPICQRLAMSSAPVSRECSYHYKLIFGE